ARLSAERISRDKALDRRIATLYMLGPGYEAEALMTADDLNEFAEKSSAFGFVLRHDRIAMEEMARLRDRSAKARAALRREADRGQVWRLRVSERVSLVWDALSTHKKAEDALAARIAQYRKEVRELEAEQRRIEDLIYRRGSTSTGPVSLRGFQWPTRGRRITSGYGRRWGGFHTGIDVDCNTGEGTHAAKAGRVIAAEWGGGYGRMVIIDHGNGVSSLYAHHSRLYVSEGRSVSRGQRIGACGSSGNSSGSHLHFEIRVNGRHRNPRPYLP
ncbi:MAG: murein hydrolase activator EnvC family protein, partial [Dongiaceae bacterium]